MNISCQQKYVECLFETFFILFFFQIEKNACVGGCAHAHLRAHVCVSRYVSSWVDP